jgi:hypothetical protein
VLGEDTRIGTSFLPVDRWMLDRLDAEGGRRGRKLPPVAWHDRFPTTPRDETDHDETSAPTRAAAALEVYDTEVPATITEPEAPLELYTEVPATSTEAEALLVDDAPMPEPEPEPEPEVVAPAPPAPAPPAPRPQPIHQELDPDVRALIDELYEQARAELSGDEVGFFAPVAPAPADPPLNEPLANEQLVDEIVAEPPAGETAPPNGSAVKRPSRARSGWVAAIQSAEARDRPRG